MKKDEFPGWDKHLGHYSKYMDSLDVFMEIELLADNEWHYHIDFENDCQSSPRMYKTAKQAIIAAEKHADKMIKAQIKKLSTFSKYLRNI